MSLIDRYIGKHVPYYCERCGREIDDNNSCIFENADVCDDCWHYAYSNEAMADFAMLHAGSWHRFLTDCVLNEGDMWWSEIVELARDYFRDDYTNFILNREKEVKPSANSFTSI